MQLESAKALGEEKISETDWKEIQARVGTGYQGNRGPVLTILANSITRGVSSTDPNASVYDRAKASFIVWARNNPRASPDELQKQSEFFHGIATKDVAVQAVKQLHSDVEPWAGVITHGYYKDRNAVTETVKQFGGGELPNWRRRATKRLCTSSASRSRTSARSCRMCLSLRER